MADKDYMLFDKGTRAMVFGFHPKAIQRMLDFDFISRRKNPSVAAIVNPTSDGLHKCFWGSDEVMIPIYKTIDDAVRKHSDISVMVNFASSRSAFSVTKEALLNKKIRVVAVIAEGVPESRTKELIKIANDREKWIIGPATVGGIAAGAFRIGNTGGTVENIVSSRLHRPGSVAFVTKSGGMLNELCNIISRTTDGVSEGISIGGDRYPGSTLLEHLLRYEKNPNVKMMVMLGEIGGEGEYDVENAIKDGRITKPLVAWCIGTCSEVFTSEVQFGHAGARSANTCETANEKNTALRAAGAIVPKSFSSFDSEIKRTYDGLVEKGKLKPMPDVKPPELPMEYSDAVKRGLVRRPAQFVTTITDERGDELKYCGIPINKIFSEDYGIGGVIGLLWFKKKLPKWASKFLEMFVLLTADHGPSVAGAHNAIVAARAGKDLVSSLASGLLTIGPRYGGAVNGAAKVFSEYRDAGRMPEFMVKDMKEKNTNIPGIGHRIKSVTNPDSRVTLLRKYAKKHFPGTDYLDYAPLSML